MGALVVEHVSEAIGSLRAEVVCGPTFPSEHGTRGGEMIALILMAVPGISFTTAFRVYSNLDTEKQKRLSMHKDS